MTGTVLVGLDDSAAARAAHRWAARYARATGNRLRAVHVLEWPVGLKHLNGDSGTRLEVDPFEIAESYLQGMKRVYRDVDSPAGSQLTFAQGDVADVLVQLSRQADLLVLGTRQLSRTNRFLAGAVNRHCFDHARCPVVSVPASTVPAGPARDSQFVGPRTVVRADRKDVGDRRLVAR